MGAYVPEEADIVWLNFTPQSGHEQAGRRPAVVLSPKAYNQRPGLLVCVPITNQIMRKAMPLSGRDWCSMCSNRQAYPPSTWRRPFSVCRPWFCIPTASGAAAQGWRGRR